ncbi:MAG: outer membrane protein assembly factor BamA [Deltaproteobacteria bacterium]|nr:MAG: outer membrane protein assembly factor BamA [Deltaproteobacteria bacterium]
MFRGNEALSEMTLRKGAVDELKSFDQQGRRRSDVDDAAFQMEITYRKAGYAFATVDYQIEQVEGETLVTFIIDEGPRVILKKIEITGNAAFKAEELLRFFEGEKSDFFAQGKLLFIKSNIQSASAQIRDFYVIQGYRDVLVAEPRVSFSDDQTEATVTMNIEEGIRYTLHDIYFLGDVIADAKDSMDNLRQELAGKPYLPRRKQTLRSRLTEIYGNLGYPKAAVEIREKQGDEAGMVVLAAEINPGPRVTISEILIQGNEKTRATFIRSRLLLQPGDRFDLELQKESFRKLYQTGLFTKVDLRLEDREGTDAWPLVVAVEEARSKELYFEPGWGSYERLRLKAGFREKNLFGTGRIFGLDATVSFKAQSLVASLSDPWFLNTDITADLPVYYNRREEPSFTRTDLGASVLFSKKLTDHLSATGGYGFRITDVSDVDPIIATGDAPSDYDYASVKAQMNYDTRNDLFFPTRGQRSFISAEYADTFLGSEITLMRLTGGMRFFLPLARYTVLGARYRTGLIIPGPDDFTLPIAERFFNGGENTVRSFDQSELGPKDVLGNPVGGLAFNVLNLELRQRLIGNLIGTLFLDYGNVSPNQTRLERGLPPYESRSEILSDTFSQYFKDFRPGVGFGLQYLLPVGPVRVDVAFNPDRRMDEDSYVIHFSVGTAF